MSDFLMMNHGSIVILEPKTDAAEDWMLANLPEDAPAWGRKGVAIEARYVGDILAGLFADGYTLTMQP